MAEDVPSGYRLIGVLIRSLARFARWQVDASGYEQVPQRGGAVVTWNHTSHVDFVITALPLLDDHGRWVRLLAMRELWDSPLLGWLPRFAHCVPVERTTSRGRQDAYRAAVGALATGDLVMVAPEGTISESAELQDFRTGAVRMAQAAGVPLVPTASWGTHRFVTTGRRPTLRGAWRLPVTIRVGAPLHVGLDEDPVAVTRQLRRRTAALLTEARSAQAIAST